jgi:hypothetical protein
MVTDTAVPVGIVPPRGAWTRPFLYHATDARNLEAILRDGLRPPGPGCPKRLPSVPGHVYLATDQGGVVGPIAWLPLAAPGGVTPAAIFEIDVAALAVDRLRPDESYLRRRRPESIEDQFGPPPMPPPTLRPVAALWARSARALGSCAYEGVIPATALRRCAVIEWDATPALLSRVRRTVCANIVANAARRPARVHLPAVGLRNLVAHIFDGAPLWDPILDHELEAWIAAGRTVADLAAESRALVELLLLERACLAERAGITVAPVVPTAAGPAALNFRGAAKIEAVA